MIGNDALSLSIGQPHRVETGSAHLKIAGLENQDGTVPFVEKTAYLAPSEDLILQWPIILTWTKHLLYVSK